MANRFAASAPKKNRFAPVEPKPLDETWDNWGNAVARGAKQGLSLGFGDELRSYSKAVGDKYLRGETGDVSTLYDRNLNADRAAGDALQDAYPVSSFGGELAGGLALPVGAAGVAGKLAAKAAPYVGNAVARVAGAVAGAAPAGGLYGFGVGEGGVNNRLISAAEGAAVGGVTGGVISGAAELAKPVISAVVKYAKPMQGVYEDLANKVGMPLDDLSKSIAVGAGTGNVASHVGDLEALGKAAVDSPHNRKAAILAARDALAMARKVTPATARSRLSELGVNKDSELLFAEYPNVVESNNATRLLRKADRDAVRAASGYNESEWAKLPDYLANSGNTRSAAHVRSTIKARQMGGRDSMQDWLQQYSPGKKTMADVEDLMTAMEASFANDYKAAHNGPIDHGALSAGLAKAVERAYARLGGRGGEHAAVLQSAIDEFYPKLSAATKDGPEIRAFLNDLQSLQDVRGLVRGRIENAKSGASPRHDLARVLQPFYDDVTVAMTAASPKWRVANDRWAGMNALDRASTIGEGLSEVAGPKQREAMQMFNRLSSPAQDMVRVGFIQKLFDKTVNAGQTHDLAKLFEKDGTFNVFRTLFGDKAVLELARKVRDMKIATETHHGLAGTRTHVRKQTQAGQDADLGVVAGAQNMSMSGIRGWLLQKATDRLRERRNRRMANVLMTPMSDTVTIARHLAELKTAHARIGAKARPAKLNIAPQVAAQLAARGLSTGQRDRDRR